MITAIKLLKRARELHQAEQAGYTVIEVPNRLMHEVRSLIWARQVERAHQRWAGRVKETTVQEWQQLVMDIGRKRLGDG